MRKYLTGAIVTLLILGVAGGAYLYGTRSDLFKKEVEAPATTGGSPTAKSLPTSQPQVDVNVSEQITAAMKSKNTQALEGYMAETVQVRLEASGCCGPITKTEAMSQLSYLDPATGWSFDPANSIILNLAAISPDYYGSGWIVGVADNEYIVSFKLNNQNLIEAYNLGASYKLLIP